MGTRGGSGQELYRQMAKKGREAAKNRPAQVKGDGKEDTNLQRQVEQRLVGGGAKQASDPTSSRGNTRVNGKIKQ